MINRGAMGTTRAALMTALALLLLASIIVTSALEEPQPAEAPDSGHPTFQPPAIPEELLPVTGTGQNYTVDPNGSDGIDSSAGSLLQTL